MRKKAWVLESHSPKELKALANSLECGWCKYPKSKHALLCDQCTDEDAHEKGYIAK